MLQPLLAAAPAGPGLAGALGLAQLQLLACTLTALLWAAALPGASASAAALLSAGDAAQASGDYSAAVRHYTAALELDKGAPMFYSKVRRAQRAAAPLLRAYAQQQKNAAGAFAAVRGVQRVVLAAALCASQAAPAKQGRC